MCVCVCVCTKFSTIVHSQESTPGSCTVYLDPTAGRSVCRPSCEGGPGRATGFSMDWNTTAAKQCAAAPCERTKVVFCDPNGLAGSGCINEISLKSCLDTSCANFAFGSGLEKLSDYVGPGF